MWGECSGIEGEGSSVGIIIEVVFDFGGRKSCERISEEAAVIHGWITE